MQIVFFALFVIIIGCFALVALLRVLGQKHLFAAALSDADLAPAPLPEVVRSASKNDALFSDLSALEPDAPAILSALEPSTAREALLARAAELGAELREQGQGWLFFVWRSPSIGFPNSLQIYIEPDENGSRISLYGRARYGRLDFGANRSFLEDVAKALTP